MEIKIESPSAYLRNAYKTSIDNGVFKMHYRVTVFFLLGSFLIISTKQFFGDPIYCVAENDKLKNILNSYCWLHGTFTLKKSPKENVVGKHVISSGVGPVNVQDEVIHHRYYQWVCIMLLLQSLMFYLPYFLWKIWENNLLKQLSSELDGAFDTSKWTTERKNSLVQFFSDRNTYTFYALRFAFCEVLNLINAVSQMYLINWLLRGSFNNYGPAVAAFLYEPSVPNSVDPMAWAFPKMTKCHFKYFGPSGSIQELDSLCVLPLNIVNEKLFAFLWFWFIFLIVISSIATFYRIAIFIFPKFRALLMMGKVRSISRIRILKIFSGFSIGQWFLLHMLSKNINPIIFKELIVEFDKEHKMKHSALV